MKYKNISHQGQRKVFPLFIAQSFDQATISFRSGGIQKYTYRVLQTIQMKLILLCVWAEPAVFGSTKTALEFKYEI